MTLKTNDDVSILEKLIDQLDGLHIEMTVLVKKSPNDAVNKFKLGLINKVLETANSLLSKAYKPFQDFDIFDLDDVPSNSDVTLIITQYRKELERFHSDNIIYENCQWVYKVADVPSTRICPSKRR